MSCCDEPGKWIVMGVVALAVAGVLAAKHAGKNEQSASGPSSSVTSVAIEGTQVQGGPQPAEPARAVPRLVDLGATKCIPCTMMAPILEDLKRTYAGRLDVQFIDVWENPDAARKYGISVIPTQIFFDATGKELFRHEGFFGKDDILAKWKELGVDLTAN